MKAAPEDQVLLLDLQRHDNDVTRIAHRITALQKGAELAELGQRTAAVRSEYGSATGDVEDAERDLARLESDSATVQARLERDTTLLQHASSSKDVAGLESEMSSLQRRLGDLETSELELMERMDTLRARVGDLGTQLAELDARQATLARNRDSGIASLTEDRAHIEANRAAIADRVPADLLALYERQRARYGFGASLLQGGVSLASGVALGSSDLAAVRASAPDDVLLCPDSEAILVRTDESGL
ncbi:zinc ribbon domain-containing protein [Curtobacterium sp. RRHDQ10]|uniref:zinc ribbon domain-containing protein n=1 Tax=Curtobacterium phyllosphaerae TaxID=3413379 RepID=UPI003BF36473